ncbi:Autophagy-related protein 22 like [Verticillium longisporum]|nr:Autophagy-related protein 22 like [Verticillium longisporum]
MVPRQDNHARPPPAPRLWSRLSNFSKKSFISFSSSFEADDERSESEDDDGDYDYHHRQLLFPAMSGRNGDRHGRDDGSPPGRYSGEDTRPTSQKELAGWYAYAFAAETYVICAIGSFIPILLETLARENGVLLSDRTTPCGTSDSKNKADGQCVVYVLGAEVNTASFAMYTFSISVLVQALLVVSISCAADHGNFRKKLLLGFAWTGSVAVMLYIFVSANTYLFGALLAIISNTSFGASFVLLNSFLPLLVRHHPDVIEAENKHVPDFAQTDLESQPMRGASAESDAASDAAPADPDATSPLLSNADAEDMVTPDWPRKATREELTSVELNLSTQISAKGIGIGYTAGLFLQCVAIGVLIAMRNTTWSQRVVLFMVGPPLPIVAASGFSGMWAWVGYVMYAWKSLFETIKLARRLLDIMLFLAAWFLLSDAIATTSSTAILFAKTQLHMKPWALGMINVISTLAGTILACIGLFETWGVGGLQQPWEMYPLAAVYGFVLGGLSGYCRSVYGELIPPGSEAAFYALYAITDKGSSVFGPAIVGAIIDRWGHIRPAFWFLAALVGLPAPLICFKVRQASEDAGTDTDSGSEDRPILSAYDDDDDDGYEENDRRR